MSMHLVLRNGLRSLAAAARSRFGAAALAAREAMKPLICQRDSDREAPEL